MILEWLVSRLRPALPWINLFTGICYRPLGIDDLFFIRTGDGECSDPGLSVIDFAATENCSWRGYTVKGAVHDENAFVMGGVAGQAGLFGTASSVHRLLVLPYGRVCRNNETSLHSKNSSSCI
jgi:hypothetical protein